MAALWLCGLTIAGGIRLGTGQIRVIWRESGREIRAVCRISRPEAFSGCMISGQRVQNFPVNIGCDGKMTDECIFPLAGVGWFA